MKRLLNVVAILIIVLVISCTKETQLGSTVVKEDPSNYFTANFSGKSLKTSGFIFTINGVTDDVNGSFILMNALLNTRNENGTAKTNLTIRASGSTSNITYVPMYKIPLQQLDASIMLERTGNALGPYKVVSFGSGSYTSGITDLTVGKKKYDIDPETTTFTVTSTDILWVQGTYSGNMLDGSTKIPVTGTFKIRI